MRGPRFLWVLESVQCMEEDRSARMVITDMLRMRVPRMGITGRTISWAACLSARVHGFTVTAAATTDAGFMGARDSAIEDLGSAAVRAGSAEAASAVTAGAFAATAEAFVGTADADSAAAVVSAAVVAAAFTAVADSVAVDRMVADTGKLLD
jgi:hypothetical protein